MRIILALASAIAASFLEKTSSNSTDSDLSVDAVADASDVDVSLDPSAVDDTTGASSDLEDVASIIHGDLYDIEDYDSLLPEAAVFPCNTFAVPDAGDVSSDDLPEPPSGFELSCAGFDPYSMPESVEEPFDFLAVLDADGVSSDDLPKPQCGTLDPSNFDLNPYAIPDAYCVSIDALVIPDAICISDDDTLSDCSFDFEGDGGSSDGIEYDFPHEALVRIFQFLPVTEIARATFVSRKFNQTATYLLTENFKTEGLTGYDFSKLYHELMRLDQALNLVRTTVENEADGAKMREQYAQISHLMIQRKALKRFLKQILEDQKMRDEVSGKALVHNDKLDFFIDALLKNVFEVPLKLAKLTPILDSPMFDLLKEYRNIEMKTYFLLPQHIHNFGVDSLKGHVEQSAEELIMLSGVFNQDREMRQKMFSLIEGKSQSLEALIETENIYDTRLISAEIGLAEFCYLDFLVVDEKSCERALELASSFISRCAHLNFLMASVLKSPLFIAKMLWLRKMRGLSVSKEIMFLSLRDFCEKTYRLTFKVEDINRSIELEDDAYSPKEKIECGLMTNIEDHILLPIIKAAANLQDTDELIWIAIQKKRSLSLIKALLGKVVLPISHPNVIIPLSEDRRMTIQFCPECTVEEMEAYCAISIGCRDDWLLGCTGEHLLAYTNFLLEVEHIFIDQSIFYILLRNADESTFKACIRYIMKTGVQGTDLPKMTYQQRSKVRDMIREALQDGIFPHKMFTKKRVYMGLDADVLEEILSTKDGLVTLLKGADDELNLKDRKKMGLASSFIKFMLYKMPSAEIGCLRLNVDFNDLMFATIIGIICKKPVKDIDLDDYSLPQCKKIYENLLRKYPKRIQRFARRIPVFPNPASDPNFAQTFYQLSSFEKTLYSILVNRGLFSILENMGLENR